MPTLSLDFTDEEFTLLKQAMQEDTNHRDLQQILRGWTLERLEAYRQRARQLLQSRIDSLSAGEQVQVREFLDKLDSAAKRG